MSDYALTRAADRDLEEIWDYTYETWGADQADRYLDLLKTCCERIATGETHCRKLPEIDPELQSHHCEHHFIFFLSREENVVIIAFLHEKMDLMVRLATRLG